MNYDSLKTLANTLWIAVIAVGRPPKAYGPKKFKAILEAAEALRLHCRQRKYPAALKRQAQGLLEQAQAFKAEAERPR